MPNCLVLGGCYPVTSDDIEVILAAVRAALAEVQPGDKVQVLKGVP